jgi:hypothetical protein
LVLTKVQIPSREHSFLEDPRTLFQWADFYCSFPQLAIDADTSPAKFRIPVNVDMTRLLESWLSVNE